MLHLAWTLVTAGRIPLVPGAVELLGCRPELHDEFRTGPPARPRRVSRARGGQGRFVAAHDDPGVRAADEGVAASRTFSTGGDFIPSSAFRMALPIRGACGEPYGMKHSIRMIKSIRRKAAYQRPNQSCPRPHTLECEDLARETALSVDYHPAGRAHRRRDFNDRGQRLGSSPRIRSCGRRVIDENGGGPGVRLQQRAKPKVAKV